MTGLFRKDLIAMLRGGKYTFAISLVFFLISLATSQINIITAMIVILFTMLPITTFSFDEMARWDKYALTLPVTRTEMVLEKYLITFLMTFAGSAVVFVMQFVSGLIRGGGAFVLSENLLMVYVMLAVCLVLSSIFLPLVYRFGAEKSRLMLMLVVFIPTFAAAVWVKLGVQMPSEAQLLVLAQAFAGCSGGFAAGFLCAFLCHLSKERTLRRRFFRLPIRHKDPFGAPAGMFQGDFYVSANIFC